MSSLSGNRRCPWAYQHLEVRGLSLLKQNEEKKKLVFPGVSWNPSEENVSG